MSERALEDTERRITELADRLMNDEQKKGTPFSESLCDWAITTARRQVRWSYDYSVESGTLSFLRDGEVVAKVYNLSPRHDYLSRRGTVISAEADRVSADRIQVSDHGCGIFSVQFFAGQDLVSYRTYQRAPYHRV